MYYYSGFDPVWYDFSPLTILSKTIIEKAINDKLAGIEYLFTPAQWKRRWGAEQTSWLVTETHYNKSPTSIARLIKKRTRRLSFSATILHGHCLVNLNGAAFKCGNWISLGNFNGFFQVFSVYNAVTGDGIGVVLHLDFAHLDFGIWVEGIAAIDKLLSQIGKPVHVSFSKFISHLQWTIHVK